MQNKDIDLLIKAARALLNGESKSTIPSEEGARLAELILLHGPTPVLNGEAYDRLVFDTAAVVAGMPDDEIVPSLMVYIEEHGGKPSEFVGQISSIFSIIRDSKEHEIGPNREEFRGHMVDEAVYEEVKEVMRKLHFDEIIQPAQEPGSNSDF